LVDALFERRQAPAQHGLAGISLDLSGRDERRVTCAERFRHETRTKSRRVRDTYGEQEAL